MGPRTRRDDGCNAKQRIAARDRSGGGGIVSEQMVAIPFRGGPANGHTFEGRLSAGIDRVEVPVRGRGGFVPAVYLVERIRGKPSHLVYIPVRADAEELDT
jgi:hypothetical protein